MKANFFQVRFLLTFKCHRKLAKFIESFLYLIFYKGQFCISKEEISSGLIWDKTVSKNCQRTMSLIYIIGEGVKEDNLKSADKNVTENVIWGSCLLIIID